MLKIPSYTSRITNTETPRVFRMTSEVYEVKTLADLRDFRLGAIFKKYKEKREKFSKRAPSFPSREWKRSET